MMVMLSHYSLPVIVELFVKATENLYPPPSHGFRVTCNLSTYICFQRSQSRRYFDTLAFGRLDLRLVLVP